MPEENTRISWEGICNHPLSQLIVEKHGSHNDQKTN